ncbi:Alkyldihydroxyacetonephosphate synthase, peroxisomal [Lamellibrachia satsuma]|nr:Alkyldihydroxyacetonephosphate synthase, peroxisomal [Lamellibrachia satsuma]
MPALRDWMINTVGISLEHQQPAQPELTAADIVAPLVNEGFLEEMQRTGISFTDDPQDRLFRAHGHTLHEVFILREGKFKRIPDLVVWPISHKQVLTVVELCNKHNVVIIPFGDVDIAHMATAILILISFVEVPSLRNEDPRYLKESTSFSL